MDAKNSALSFNSTPNVLFFYYSKGRQKHMFKAARSTQTSTKPSPTHYCFSSINSPVTHNAFTTSCPLHEYESGEGSCDALDNMSSRFILARQIRLVFHTGSNLFPHEKRKGKQEQELHRVWCQCRHSEHFVHKLKVRRLLSLGTRKGVRNSLCGRLPHNDIVTRQHSETAALEWSYRHTSL